MKTNAKLAVLAAALSLYATAPALAYNVSTCFDVPIKWPNTNPTLGAASASFPDGYWRNGLQRTVNLTNLNPSPFFFNLITDPEPLGMGNGQSEIWGSVDQGLLNGSPAVTYSWNTCLWVFTGEVIANRDESDVIFDYTAPFQWTADELKSSLIMYTGTLRQLQGTGIHELGHALGLMHVNTEYNVMGEDFAHMWANGNTVHGYLGEDASDGTVFLYGLRSDGYEDLSVTHWEYAQANGEYSWHKRTGIYDKVGAILPSIMVQGEPGYKVKRGQTVQVDFTYENNGKSPQNVAIGWYISTDPTITRTDRIIAGEGLINYEREDVWTYRKTLKIPKDLIAGKNYWIGTIIDRFESVADAVPSNNATYIPVKVK